MQKKGHSLTLVLVLMVIASGFVLERDSRGGQDAEQKGLDALRAVVARKSPSESELRRVESQFPHTRAAGLAQFGRGYARYAASDFAAAADLLSHAAIEQKTALGDQALYLVAKSFHQLKQLKDAESAFARVVEKYPDSMYLRESGFAAAQLAADRGAYREAISYLKRLVDQKDPGALSQTAEYYQKLGEPKRALDLYQEVYFDLPPSQEALEAEKQLEAAGVFAKASSGFPLSRLRARFERLHKSGAHADAVEYYERFLANQPQATKDGALTLQYGRSLYESSSTRRAIEVLSNLNAKSSELRSEVLYWLAESYLRGGQAATFVETSRALVKQFPKSSWAAATLYSRAKYYLRVGSDGEAVQAFKELVELHPQSDYAPEATYRIGMKAYFAGQYREAGQYLIQHVEHYVNSDYYGPSLYWAGRAAERDGRRNEAAAIFERVLERYRYTFYGQMAQERLETLRPSGKDSKPAKPNVAPSLNRALANVKSAQPPEETLSDEATAHLTRARDLRFIRVDDLAMKELQQALRQAPRSRAVSLELARLYRDQGQYRAAISLLQQAHPEYTLYQGGEVPREVEEILFPIAYWEMIQKESRKNGLDPYVVAGLIRQESAFDPNARSRANARGLMQLIPSTGRLVARRHGLRRISPSQLYEPELNVQLGTSFFASLVDRLGRIEFATAAYNGGPTRVARWRREIPYQEIDEWVENIPIRETRLYVQAVIRNAAHYRRLYGRDGDS